MWADLFYLTRANDDGAIWSATGVDIYSFKMIILGALSKLVKLGQVGWLRFIHGPVNLLVVADDVAYSSPLTYSPAIITKLIN